MFGKLLLLLLTLLFLFSCGREYTCAELLSRMLRVSGGGSENGLLYVAEAVEGDVGYLSRENADLLYGEGAYGAYFSLLEDFSLFISAREPQELAVFKCRSASDCEAVAQMCLRRADSIKIALRGTAYEERAKGISVEIHGRAVVFYFTEESRRVACEINDLL